MAGLLATVTLVLLCLNNENALKPADAEGTLTRVVGFGDPSPFGGLPLRDVNFLQLADDGSVAFDGCVGGCDQVGIFVKHPNEPLGEPVIQSGDLSPGGESLVGQQCNHYLPFSRNDSGTIAFFALLESCNSARQGVYLLSGSGLSTLGESGDVVDGESMTYPSYPLLTDNGSTAFSACFASCTRGAVVVGNDRILTPLTQLWSGAQLAGHPGAFGMNDSGQILHQSSVKEFGVEKSCLVISTSTGASHTRVACVGDELFGLPLDSQVRVVDFNRNGNLAFGSSDQAVYFWSGSASKVVRAGEPTPLGGTYRQMIGYPHINDLDQITFSAEVEHADGRRVYTVFLYSSGVVTPLFQAGVDTDPVSGRCLSDNDINNAGQVLVNVSDCGGSNVAFYVGSFTAPPPPPKPKRAVLFIGGIGSYGYNCSGSSQGDDITGDTSWMRTLLTSNRSLTSRISIDGYYYFSYSGNYCANGNPLYTQTDTCNQGINETYFDRLKSRIASIVASDPGVKVSIVAHSQGGLIASYLVGRQRLVDQSWLRTNVASVITFDSFPEGMGGYHVLAADTFYDWNEPWYDGCPNELYNEIPYNLNDWDQSSSTSDVPETARNAATPFGSDNYQVAFHTLERSDEPLLGPPSSATHIRGERFHERIPGTNHSAIWNTPNVRTANLIACNMISGLKPTSAGHETSCNITFSTLTQGQTSSTNVQVPGNTASAAAIPASAPTSVIALELSATWSTGDVGLTVVNPSGQRYTASNLPPGATHESSEGLESFSFNSPQGGTWALEATGEDVPAGGTELTVVTNVVLKDDDFDGEPDLTDGCPSDAEDTDGYQDADGCPDPDNDSDGISDAADNCPDHANTAQTDGNSNGVGDVCEADLDPSSTPTATPVSTSSPTPTLSSPTPTGTTPTVIIMGDADCNGTPNAEDLLDILQYVGEVGGIACLAAADVDCDQVIASSDALGVLVYLADIPRPTSSVCPAVGSQMTS